MHIAMLAPANMIHTVRWANALAERGVTVDLLSAHALSRDLAPTIRTHLLRWRAPHGYFLNAAVVRGLLREHKPDLLHAHFASGYGTLAQLAGYPRTLLSVWGSDVFDFPTKSPIHRRLVVRGLRRATRVCSISEVMADKVEELAPGIMRPDVIPWGVDTDFFAPGHRAPSGDNLVIGTVKSLKPKYGVDTLIEGFARCRQRLRDKAHAAADRLRLRIAGGGPDRQSLEQLARRLGVAAVTTFVGEVAHGQVPQELNQLDIYAAMSRYDSESFGVAIIEASATGRPVVVSDAGGLPEVVEEGQTGCVVPRDNPEALAETLFALIVSPEERRRLGANGRRRVQACYEWGQCVEKQIDLYRELAPPPTGRGRVAGPTLMPGANTDPLRKTA